MSPLLKKFQALTLALLILISPLLSTAQEPAPLPKHFVEYGMDPERIPTRSKPRTTLPPRMTVSRLLRSLELFRKAGGIMFDAPAKPCEALTKVPLRLSYDPNRPDGEHLTLHAGKKAYSIDGVRDGDLRPIAMFAQSPVPVLANIQTPDPSLRDSCKLPSTDLRIVSLHQVFVDTQLGWLLTRMDSIPWSFSQGKRWDKEEEPLPEATVALSKSLGIAVNADQAEYLRIWPKIRSEFFNQGLILLEEMTAEDRARYVNDVTALDKVNFKWKELEDRVRAESSFDEAKWQELDDQQKHVLLLLILALYDQRVSNFNDDEATPSFCTEASTIKLDGLPKLEFIAPRKPKNHVFPRSSNLMTENLDQLRLVDQEAYDGMVTIYRLAGLFRYVKRQQGPAKWNQFIKSLPPPEKKSTYVVLCPQCEKDAVEKWWQCAESKIIPPRPRRRPSAS